MSVDDLLAWIPLRWLVFAHVLAAFAFLLVHGPSVFAMMMLRRERDLGAVRGLLRMSQYASGLSWTAWALLGVTGILLALVERSWRQTWVWASALVLVVVSGAMSPLAARAFNEARGAAGLPWFDGTRMRPATQADPAALDRALDVIGRRAPLVLTLGVAGAAALVWLMTYRPA